jgi:hypothetical protein
MVGERVPVPGTYLTRYLLHTGYGRCIHPGTLTVMRFRDSVVVVPVPDAVLISEMDEFCALSELLTPVSQG